MAVAANVTQTFQMIGVREDLSDVITNIMPLETPMYSFCKKRSTGSRTPEWQRDIDADPNPTNAAVEGDTVSIDAGTQPQRLKNIVQLFDKKVSVSTTANAVRTAGRANEMKYQMAKKGREIKRDIEARMNGNYASAIGNTSTAGQMAGAEAYITSNFSRGVGGSGGGYQTNTGLISVATDGTTRVITEDMFKTVISQCWTNSDGAEMILCGPRMKQKISTTFTGIAQLRLDVGNQNNKTLSVGGLDLYKSDFGVHKIMPTRLGCYGTGRTRPYRSTGSSDDAVINRTVLVLSPETWTVSMLQPFKQTELAKVGHAENRMLYTELTLECSDERANGVVADVTIA